MSTPLIIDYIDPILAGFKEAELRKNVKPAELLFIHILRPVRITNKYRQLQLLNEFKKRREIVL